MKRLADARPAAAVLATIIAVAVLSATVSHAAGLNLAGRSGGVFAELATRCTDGPVTVSPSGLPTDGRYTQVTVSGISGTCAGGNVSGYLASSPETVVFSGSGTVSGSSMVVSTAAFTPPTTADGRVVVGLDRWVVPATWSFTPPPPASAVRCYPVNSSLPDTCAVRITGWNNWGSGYRMDFEVTTTSAAPFRWEVELDLSVTTHAAPGGGTLFPGYPVPAGSWWESWTPAGFSASNVCSASAAANLPKVRLRGVTWNRDVSASSPAGSMGFQAGPTGSGLASFACG